MRNIDKAIGLGLSVALLSGACSGDDHEEPRETPTTRVDQNSLREANEAHEAAQAALDEANESWRAYEQRIGEQCTRLLYPYLPGEVLDDASEALIVAEVSQVSTDERCNTDQEIRITFRGLRDHYDEAHYYYRELGDAEANIAVIEAGGTIPEDEEY